MTQLVGFAGSLRAGSYNRALLRAAAAAMPDGASLEVLSIDDVPLYNGDVEERDGIPAAVQSIKDKIAAADGLVIATPEYNGGVPGVAKNVIDWISRPGSDIPRVTHGKPVALMGATPGGLGTAFSQAGWLQVLRTLRFRVWVGGGPFYLSSAPKSFDDDLNPNDELKERVATYMAGFVKSLE
ncbi:MAG: NAD(P)H-dependent oxidoreductase [Gammaproteobacteria bacterium]|nr:NAD(P)H-dependent oxidoreductase [Gammaproteobacteria bacterium]